jgi:2-keto-4-pentenoate hydratase/2-oxohepta-3-ene-1,7-dioic acid hydratase in catechol pathway
MMFPRLDVSASTTPSIVRSQMPVLVANLVLVKEGGRPVPPLPSLFFKGSTSIAGHGDVVEIPKICQDDQADYEGELVVIIGKDAKNVSKDNALDYVLGYTAGNDLSSRLCLPPRLIRQQLRPGNGNVIQNLQEAYLNGDSQNRIPLDSHYLTQV